jgi:DNA modification methylase
MPVLNQRSGDDWVLYHGDSAEVLAEVPEHSVHLLVTSPPFSNVYSYSPSDRDMGNVKDDREFFAHMEYLTAQIKRVMVPGRVVAMHCYDIQRYESKHGIRHRYDFPGDLIRHMAAFDFAHVGRITIDKNPQTQAIRNHPQELLFATMRRDAAKSGVAQADYVLIFRAPGNNPVPVEAPIDEDTWIQWARPVWSDIRETEILDTAGSRGTDDERHIAPLQLGVIERCVKLWSNPGEVVLDPFMGIGSTGVVALRAGRKALGCELKPEYWESACRHLGNAKAQQSFLSEVS